MERFTLVLLGYNNRYRCFECRKLSYPISKKKNSLKHRNKANMVYAIRLKLTTRWPCPMEIDLRHKLNKRKPRKYRTNDTVGRLNWNGLAHDVAEAPTENWMRSVAWCNVAHGITVFFVVLVTHISLSQNWESHWFPSFSAKCVVASKCWSCD